MYREDRHFVEKPAEMSLRKQNTIYLALFFEYPPANCEIPNSRESQSSRTLSLVGICIVLVLAKLFYCMTLVILAQSRNVFSVVMSCVVIFNNQC